MGKSNIDRCDGHHAGEALASLPDLHITPTICDCGHPPTQDDGCGTGYGRDTEGRTYCYACCADRDRETMLQCGYAVLYLTSKPGITRPLYQVTNWPGSLRFDVYHRKVGKHNIAGRRYDVWFQGPDQLDSARTWWHGVQYGDNTQVCHCRRVKD